MPNAPLMNGLGCRDIIAINSAIWLARSRPARDPIGLPTRPSRAAAIVPPAAQKLQPRAPINSSCTPPVDCRQRVARLTPVPRGLPDRRSYVPLQLAAEQRARHAIELVIPHRSMVERLIEGPQMRQLVHQRVEAVMAGVAADEDRPVAAHQNAADLASVNVLDHGFAHQVHAPSPGHFVAPDARPGPARKLGDILAPNRPIRIRHRRRFAARDLVRRGPGTKAACGTSAEARARTSPLNAARFSDRSRENACPAPGAWCARCA